MGVDDSPLGPRGFRGYTTHQEFGGHRIPVPVQNLILRDYAARRTLLFKLSVDEYFFTNCYLQLETILGQLDELEGILMCSLFMLPPDESFRRGVYERVLTAQGQLHLVFEGLVVKDQGTVEAAEELIQMNQCLKQAPVSIDSALLPSLAGLERFSSEA